MRRFWTGLAIAISFAAITAGGIVVTDDSGGGEPGEGGILAANIWVDTNGGTCQDNASQVSYSDSVACASLDAANDTCENGDVVGVKGGTYPDQEIRGLNSRTNYCTFSFYAGDTVTIDVVDWGLWNDCDGPAPGFDTANYPIAGWVKIIGDRERPSGGPGFVFQVFRADCGRDTWIENVDINARDEQIAHPFSFDTAVTDATILNNNIRNAHNSDAFFVTGGDGFIIEGNDIHGLTNDTGGSIHDECFRSNSSINVTMTRNHFWDCAVYNTFLTGDANATNWVVENNIFESPKPPHTADCFAFRGGGDSSTPSPDGMIFRYNTFGKACGIQYNTTDNSPTSNGWTVVGNVFGTGGFPCGAANTTYDDNVAPTGTSACAGGTTFSSASLLAGFVNPVTVDNSESTHEEEGNYHINSSSPLCNIGGTGSYPADDIDDEARFLDSAPEVGADEFAGCS